MSSENTTPMRPAEAVRPGVEHDPKVPGLQLRHRVSSSSWYLWYRLDGKEHRPKIGDSRVITRPQARQIALQWLAEIAQGRHPKEQGERRTVADLRARYDEVHAPRKKESSRRDDASLWNQLIIPALGHRDVAKLTIADINDFHHSLRETPYRANRAIALLSKAFNLAIRWGWLTTSPVKVERFKETKRRRVPAADETRRLFEALEAMRPDQPWFAGLIELLIFTGCRCNEIAKAKWEWVKDGALHLPDSKTGEKVVPLNEPAREAMAKIPRIVGNPYIICGRGRSHFVSPRKRWLQLLAAARIKDLRIHDLRRLYVSTSLSAGLPLDQIGQVVGHKSIQTTRGYAWLQQDAARAAAEIAGQQFERLRKTS